MYYIHTYIHIDRLMCQCTTSVHIYVNGSMFWETHIMLFVAEGYMMKCVNMKLQPAAG